MNKEELIGFTVIILLIIAVTLSLNFITSRYDAKKENCVNAGYVYVDKQCLNVEVIEL
tara:strand:+ start:301 stop:474 length:174 start_codon:yes stop_codon:yes gene_type:complete